MKLLSMLKQFFRALTRHYSLHTPEHVGQFAGALVPLGDWQHH